MRWWKKEWKRDIEKEIRWEGEKERERERVGEWKGEIHPSLYNFHKYSNISTEIFTNFWIGLKAIARVHICKWKRKPHFYILLQQMFTYICLKLQLYPWRINILISNAFWKPHLYGFMFIFGQNYKVFPLFFCRVFHWKFNYYFHRQ